MFNDRKNYVWSWSRTCFEESEWTRYSRTFIVKILLNTYIISGSQTPRTNPPSQDPRWSQCSSNPSRVDNATGYTNTLHPSPSTDFASLPPRPATVAKDSSPRSAAQYFYCRSTPPSSMHTILSRQLVPSLAATDTPLEFSATKTSSKPLDRYCQMMGRRWRRWRYRVLGPGNTIPFMIAAGKSLQCISHPKGIGSEFAFELLQHKVPGRPDDAPGSSFSSKWGIVPMEHISRPGMLPADLNP